MSNQVGDCFKFVWPFHNIRTLKQRTNLRWRFRKNFWPSQNIWTLSEYISYKFHNSGLHIKKQAWKLHNSKWIDKQCLYQLWKWFHMWHPLTSRVQKTSLITWIMNEKRQTWRIHNTELIYSVHQLWKWFHGWKCY